ncbi:uncharacterized protein LAJ45_04077 [Morchella importuna]|uniref:Thioesterase/thiol ester dehydrase-isomerase n=1 Tax=Morchella conica CCBAS932 TaxID=1392247 RepID=A0A3N4L4Q2_9PEZI|nr:uncharacterized protein LAJ45_04077 [Morchella importuna]KAH8152083.1 hypothetical protein LAJ45_04077 [Morchella importuna]RPB16482.1 Thioesterase/thiol ester dehydrase-isomerase [Morchella conica CCBAS932]
MTASTATPRPTLKTIPPMNPELSLLENNLELSALEEMGDGVFTNSRPLWKPDDARGIYGGCIIAQCLKAAQGTVPKDLKVHSMHCYFILAGNPTIPVVYHVERVRSGRSFATRTVQARQRGQCIFTTTCSFMRAPVKEQSKIEHSMPIPAGIPLPEECVTDDAQLLDWYEKGRIDEAGLEKYRRRREKDPIEYRQLGIAEQTRDAKPTEKRLRQWVRIKGAIKDDEAHLPALAYYSDAFFLVTAAKVNPLRMDDIGMMVSLDHTIYFHHAAEIKADEWVFMELESSWAGEERALVTQRIWNRDGLLLASCYQEGLIRLKKDEGKGVVDLLSKL